MIAVAVVAGVWWGDVMVRADGLVDARRVIALIVTAIAVVAWRPRPTTVFVVLVVGLATLRSAVEWRAESPPDGSPIDGVATVVTDPVRRGAGVSLVIDVDGRRLDARAYGRPASKLDSVAAGERIAMRGIVRAFDADRRRRALVRHSVARAAIEWVDTRPPGRHGSPLARAANRVRAVLAEGASRLGDAAGLATGLLYGDDRDQSSETIAQFRASGLAHLTAVSGQNVAYVLTVFAPLLTRLRRSARFAATVLVIAWFVTLTRAEPSVVRAGLVAAVSAAVFAFGRPRSGTVIVALAVIVGSLVDPMLVWSVGWWMSVGGALGLAALAPWLAERREPSWWTSLVSSTVGAQLGVLPVAVAVFGWPSPIALPCNLVAAPVAGAVMLAGLPASLVAGVLPERIGGVVMAPIGLGVRFVAATARLGAAIEIPDPAGALLLGCGLVAAVAWCRRAGAGVATS